MQERDATMAHDKIMPALRLSCVASAFDANYIPRLA
jgi:hypothetical protein